MNYFGPLQKVTPEGKPGNWDYTCTNDGAVWPIGYCEAFREFSQANIDMIYNGDMERYEKYIAPHRAAAADGKYHSDGHATAEEACECYKTYLLDFNLRFHPFPGGEAPDTLHKCQAEGCLRYTASLAECGCGMREHWYLCSEHLNRDEVNKLMRVGQSAES